MPNLNWGMIQDGGAFESLMHALLYAEYPDTILFGRPGPDQGQDARSSDGCTVYQAKYRQNLDMDGAIAIALKELDQIKKYRQPAHNNYGHWKAANRWILASNVLTNPNDDAKWQRQVVPSFAAESLVAAYWTRTDIDNKLIAHPEIASVFFDGENRVLVGLREAYDLLSMECGNNHPLDMPFVGRDRELTEVTTFASSGDKQLMCVLGPGGIGKSRLLYESLQVLADQGWRVFWGLPGTMSTSSQWFRLLNGNQPTCVALDDPDDPNLLRQVWEQLSAPERKNWRVLVACRSDKTRVMRWLQTNPNTHPPINLSPLSESDAHKFLSAYSTAPLPQEWVHQVTQLAWRTPGWLALIGGLLQQNKLQNLQTTASALADRHVETAIEQLPSDHAEARTLLRWVALWGTFVLNSDGSPQLEFHFLAKQGISETLVRHLLAHFVKARLIQNWGVSKRLYTIEPLIVRQYVLSSWLLACDTDPWKVSDAGTTLVRQLLSDQVPNVDRAIASLFMLARTQLPDDTCALFLKPIFDELASIAKKDSVVDQSQVIALLERMGQGDPESALDVIIAIRQNKTTSFTQTVPIWGEQNLTHASLVTKLPWLLFQLAEYVDEQPAARRYLNEFSEYFTSVCDDELERLQGKGPERLLLRLLCESRNSSVFLQPALDFARESLAKPTTTNWPFLRTVLEALLNPVRESTEWVASFTLSMRRHAIMPNSPEWTSAQAIRLALFEALTHNTAGPLTPDYWQLLAKAHQRVHQLILQGKPSGAGAAPYVRLLEDDLTNCLLVFNARTGSLTLGEAAHARDLWAWYLKYGADTDPVTDLARKCEACFSALSKWNLQAFFEFTADAELAPETTRVAEAFFAAKDLSVIKSFFDEAKVFLDSSRNGSVDMADDWRIAALACECSQSTPFDPPSADKHPTTSFVRTVLQAFQPDNPLAWGFAVKMCERTLFNAKATEPTNVVPILGSLLGCVARRSLFVWNLYSNAHPKTVGALTSTELNAVLDVANDLDKTRCAFLLGEFYSTDPVRVQTTLSDSLASLASDIALSTKLLNAFISGVRLSALRYGWKPEHMPFVWVFEQITALGCDASIMDKTDLEWLYDRAAQKLKANHLKAFLSSRIDAEKRANNPASFSLVPHEVDIGRWFLIDATDPECVANFHACCDFVLSDSYISIYWLPKLLAQLDASGDLITAHLAEHIANHPSLDATSLARLARLASGYDDSSEPWAKIAKPICSRALVLPKEDRRRIYFNLCNKGTRTWMSAPGEVADAFIKERDSKQRLLDLESPDSPLREYRTWQLQSAESMLQHERERAEEVRHG